MTSVLRWRSYKKRGIKIMTGTKFEGAVVDGDSVATLHDGKRESEIRVEMVLVAIGRAPVTGGLNLDAAGVKTNERGQVPVTVYANQYPDGLAIGDIVPTLHRPYCRRAMSRLTTLQVKAPRLLITS